MKNWTKVLALAIMAIASTVAFADIRTLESNVDGKGKIDVNGRQYALTGASIKFNQNGTFDLTLKANRESWKMKGDWSRVSSNKATLSANLGATTGQRAIGWVTSKGVDALDELSLTNVRGETFRASFTSTAGIDNGTRPPGQGGNWRNGQFEDAVYGEGTYRTSSRTRRIQEARVQLSKNGKAFIWLIMTEGNALQLNGEWFDRRDDKVDLRIDDAGRDGNADARGQITIDRRNQLFRIDIDGRFGRDNIDIRFQRDDNAGGSGDNGSWFDLDQTTRGRGSIEKRGDRWELDNGRVRLNKNGTFEVTLKNTKSYKYSGRYQRRGDTAYLTITGGGDGSGTVVVRGNRFIQIDLDVRDGQDRLRFRFTPD